MAFIMYRSTWQFSEPCQGMAFGMLALQQALMSSASHSFANQRRWGLIWADRDPWLHTKQRIESKLVLYLAQKIRW